MKRNTTRKFSSILMSVLFLGVMFIASSIGAKAYAEEYVDVATDVGFNIGDVGIDGNGNVYAIDTDTGNIVRMESDGTNMVVLCTVESAECIAVDDVNQYIYITNGTRVVQRMNIDEADVIDFVTLKNDVRCVAVDDSGCVYVGETGVGIVRIESDGTIGPTIISINSGNYSVVSIAVDDVNKDIYYLERHPHTGYHYVYRLNIDGSDVPIQIGSNPSLSDVTVGNNSYVYYTQTQGIYRLGSGRIYQGMAGSIVVDEYGCVYVSKGQAIHKIMTVEQLMDETRECIAKHIDNGDIMDIGSSLVSKFDNFFANFDLENNTAALNQLDAFMNEVSSQRGEKISEDVANALIVRAQTLHNIMTGEQSAVEKIVELKGLIAEYLDNEEIEANTAARLVSKLDNCSASLDKEDNTAAANQLNAFINEVSAQSGKKIAEGAAEGLIGTAKALLEMIQAPPEGDEAITSDTVPTIAEEPEQIEDPIVEEAGASETMSAEEQETSGNVPIVAENPAVIPDAAVEEEAGALETVPAEESKTDEAAITEEAIEATLPTGEETNVSATEEMLTDSSTIFFDTSAVVEEVQP